MAELFEQRFPTNLFGAMHVIRAVLPVMRAQGHDQILNMSSITGLTTNAGDSAYSASKFALEGLSEALALDLAPLGIRVILIEPGLARTDYLDGTSVRFGDLEIPPMSSRASARRPSSTAATMRSRRHRRGGGLGPAPGRGGESAPPHRGGVRRAGADARPPEASWRGGCGLGRRLRLDRLGRLSGLEGRARIGLA